jgi:hypothetical protein
VLSNVSAFKFDQCPYQMKDELAAGRHRIDLLGEADECDAAPHKYPVWRVPQTGQADMPSAI